MGGSQTPDLAQSLPHGVHGIVSYPVPWWQVLLAAQAVVLFCCLAFYLWRRYRPKSHVASGQMAVVRDPYEVLWERLSRLTLTEPFDRKAQIEWTYQLSLGLREAFEGFTGENVTDKTYRELEGPLRQRSPLPADETEATLAFLQEADLVKYAEQPLTPEDALARKDQVLQWVKQLRPIPKTDYPMPTDHLVATDTPDRGGSSGPFAAGGNHVRL